MHREGRYLVVTKSDYKDNLGLLTASLKSSKKGYMTFNDPTIIHRAVIKSVLIPEVELEVLDKAVKPAYWNVLQDLKESKGLTKFEKFDSDKFVKEIGTLYSLGFSDEDDLKSVMKYHNISDSESKVVISPNKYCIVTKKF